MKLLLDTISTDTLYLGDTGQGPKPSASSTLENSLLIKLSSLKKKNIYWRAEGWESQIWSNSELTAQSNIIEEVLWNLFELLLELTLDWWRHQAQGDAILMFRIENDFLQHSLSLVMKIELIFNSS